MHLQAHLGEIGLTKKEQHLAQPVDAEIVELVIRVDDGVERLDGRQGLHGLVRSAEVGTDLFTHGDQVGRGLLVVVLELMGQVVAKAQQPGIELVEMRLLFCRIPDRLLDGPSQSVACVERKPVYPTARTRDERQHKIRTARGVGAPIGIVAGRPGATCAAPVPPSA